MLFIAGGLLATSYATSMAMVYAAYGVGIGVGIALVYTPAIACVQPWFTKRRGLAAGIASAGIGAGTVVVPLLASAAISAFEWREALRWLALGAGGVGLAAAWLLRRAPNAASSGASASGATLGEALRSRNFQWLYLMAFVASPVMFIPFAHVSAAARDLQIGDAQAVGLVGLIGIGSLVGRFAIGALADRLGRVRTLVLVQASMGASYLLWGVAGAGVASYLAPYLALAVFAVWFGLSYGGIVSLMPAICMDLFGARAVSSIVGTLYTGAALGNLLGPVVAGAVFDRSASYAAVIAGCIGLAAVATIAAARLARPAAPGY